VSDGGCGGKKPREKKGEKSEIFTMQALSMTLCVLRMVVSRIATDRGHDSAIRGGKPVIGTD
jgi:hypothetical protein